MYVIKQIYPAQHMLTIFKQHLNLSENSELPEIFAFHFMFSLN